jgi:hypothetical protein
MRLYKSRSGRPSNGAQKNPRETNMSLVAATVVACALLSHERVPKALSGAPDRFFCGSPGRLTRC